MFLTVRILLYFLTAFFFYKDSKNRGINGFIWFFVSLLFCWKGVFGFGTKDIAESFILLVLYFVFYFSIRPKGELMYCSKCLNKKLSGMIYCPHCFNLDDQLLKSPFKIL